MGEAIKDDYGKTSLLARAIPTATTPTAVPLPSVVADFSEWSISRSETASFPLPYQPLEPLVRAYNAISSTLDPRRVAEILTTQIMQMLGGDAIAVMVTDERGWLSVAASHNLSPAFLQTLAGALEQTISWRAVIEERPFAVWDLRQVEDRRISEAARLEGVTSAVCAPLLFNGKAVGTINLYSRDLRRFNEDEFHILSLLASQGAIALTNARAYHALQAQATEIRSGFQRVGEALSASLDVHETLRIIVQQAMEITHAQGGAVFMRGDLHEGGGMRLAGVRGIDRRSIRRFRLAPASFIAERAMNERRTVIVPDTRRVSEMAFPTLRLSLEETAETRSVICVPLLIGDRPLGVLEQYSTDPHLFAQDDVELLTTFAYQAAIAVENARLYAQECSIAETLQKAFLPELPASIAGFQIGRVYAPGNEAAAVGGDTYDLFTLPDGRIAALIADVSGQGTYAATLAIMAKYTVRSYALENPDPSSVLARVNEALVQQTNDSTFVTLTFALIDPQTRTVSLASAAHPPTLLCRAVASLGDHAQCFPVGSEPGLIAGFLRRQEYPTQHITLTSGDVLVFYTDGVIEARRHKTMFAQERLVRVISENAHLSAQEIAAAIYSAVTDYVEDTRSDDLALLVLKAD